ncbi:MAG TPA: chorismate mutase [Patescibacteria group bacterium]|nr:chorismate mutase [Patescibacteria group bacterium]
MNMTDLGELRERINGLNEEIVELLAKRAEVAKSIGETKRSLGLPVVDWTRETVVYEQVRALALRHDLNENDVERVFQDIVNLCTNAQLEGGR